MSLKGHLDESMKTAMKARDDLRLSAVRMVRSMVKNREIDQKKELNDQEIIEVMGLSMLPFMSPLKLTTSAYPSSAPSRSAIVPT